jgi:hypothetical protein
MTQDAGKNENASENTNSRKLWSKLRSAATLRARLLHFSWQCGELAKLNGLVETPWRAHIQMLSQVDLEKTDCLLIADQTMSSQTTGVLGRGRT